LLDVDVDGVLLPYGGPDETPAGGGEQGFVAAAMTHPHGRLET